MTGITQAGWTALNWALAAPVFHKITWIDVDHFSIPVNTSGYAGDYNAAVDNGTISSGRLPQTPVTTIGTQTDSAQSTNSVEALIDTYASAVLGRTSIEGGEWSFKTWCYSDSATNTNTIVIRVYSRTSAGVETELFNVETADLGTANTLSQISSIQPAFAIAVTDHLVVKYFAKSNRNPGVRICYLTHNGTTNYTHIKTPLAMSHNQLGGLKGESPWNHLSDAQLANLHAPEENIAHASLTGLDADDHPQYLKVADYVAGETGEFNTVLCGTTDPDEYDGEDGDFYINTTTHYIFGPRVAGVWGAGTSLIGPAGADGDTGTGGGFLSGVGEPDEYDGVDGDFYIDTSDSEPGEEPAATGGGDFLVMQVFS
jgi:hypothetical protein